MNYLNVQKRHACTEEHGQQTSPETNDNCIHLSRTASSIQREVGTGKKQEKETRIQDINSRRGLLRMLFM